MATTTQKLGNITIARSQNASITKSLAKEIEIVATGISTIDGMQKNMALLVPMDRFANPAELFAYVAHNAYLVP